jgi:hypothetical protein
MARVNLPPPSDISPPPGVLQTASPSSFANHELLAEEFHATLTSLLSAKDKLCDPSIIETDSAFKETAFDLTKGLVRYVLLFIAYCQLIAVLG